jgi:transposase
MARPPRGKEVLEKAKELLSRARTANDLRRAQAVVLPLEFGFSIERTAAIIGVSKGWASHLRTQFIRTGGAESKRRRGGRRRENMTYAEETAFLAPFFEKEAKKGVLVVREIKEALDARLGRTTALASTYNLLHRHGWKKPAGYVSRIDAQEGWKSPSNSSPPSTRRGRSE